MPHQSQPDLIIELAKRKLAEAGTQAKDGIKRAWNSLPSLPPSELEKVPGPLGQLLNSSPPFRILGWMDRLGGGMEQAGKAALDKGKEYTDRAMNYVESLRK